MYQAICFDLFNTLVNVARVPQSVGPLTADILGLDHEIWREACFGAHHEICRPTRGLDNLRRMVRAIDPAIPDARIRQAAAARQRRFDHALREVDPRTLIILERLRATGYRLVLISNASTDEVCAWPASPLAPLFEHSLFSCEVGASKPDDAIYRQALDRLSLPAAACLFVGDGGSDEHRGARASGMTPVWLTEHIRPRRRQQMQADLAGIVAATVNGLAELESRLQAGTIVPLAEKPRP